MKKKKILISVIALVLLIAIALTVYFVATLGNEDLKSVTVSVTIDGVTQDYSLKSKGAYVVDVLNDLQEKNKDFSFSTTDGAYGAYLTVVNERTADEAKHEFYSLYINGDFAAFGISEQPVADGDAINLTLSVW